MQSKRKQVRASTQRLKSLSIHPSTHPSIIVFSPSTHPPTHSSNPPIVSSLHTHAFTQQVYPSLSPPHPPTCPSFSSSNFAYPYIHPSSLPPYLSPIFFLSSLCIYLETQSPGLSLSVFHSITLKSAALAMATVQEWIDQHQGGHKISHPCTLISSWLVSCRQQCLCS